MFTTLLSAIAAIPELLNAVRELLAYFKRADEEKWFQKSDQTFKEVKDAKTEEDRAKAAKDVQDLIKNT